MVILLKKSPLAPKTFPKLPKISGLKLTSMNCGIRKSKNPDLIFVSMREGTNSACFVTKSKMPSAPVLWCKKIRKYGKARALVVNSGNANAHTGKEGNMAVNSTVKVASKLINCIDKEVYVASTGVIGEKLPVNLITRGILKLHKANKSTWEEIANSIRTTDTFSKASKSICKIEGKNIKIVGIAKGSGMIFPNMGTMLSFIFTDLKIPSKVLSTLLKDGIERSFNSITVDSDTSTSDTCAMFATGTVNLDKPIKSSGDKRLRVFKNALDKLLLDLAKQIVCDGEGASKLINISVTGAKSERIARKIGLVVANSPLVKTAIAGEDPNWGRIIMAVGKAGIDIPLNLLSVSIGNLLVSDSGMVSKKYSEAKASNYMKNKEIKITINIGNGKFSANVWTCDLTHDYVKINSDYRS